MEDNTVALIDDVADLVDKGQHVPVAPGDFMLNHSTRSQVGSFLGLLNRNKRNIGMTAVGMTAAGVLTGGVAPAIVLAGKVAGFVGHKYYTRWKLSRHMERITQLFDKLLDAEGNFKNKDWALGEGGSAAANFSKILPDIQYLICHKDFSKMVDSFVCLVDATDKFNRDFTRYGKKISSCGEAIKTLESAYLVNYHFERLRPAINFFDQLVVFITIETSRLADESEKLYSDFMSRFAGANNGEIMGILNSAANSSGVMNSKFWNTDYNDWCMAVLSPWSNGLFIGPVLTGGDINSEKGMKDKLADATVKKTGDIASKTISGQVASIGLRQVLGAPSVEAAAAAGSAGVGMALNIAVQVANAEWNTRRYKSAQNLTMTGWVQQDVRERVKSIKSTLKPNLERLVTKFSHWLISHEEFKRGLTGGNLPISMLAEKALRARKHWAQSVGSDAYKMICEFHEVVVGAANVEWEKVFGDQHQAEKREQVIKDQKETRYAASVWEATGETSREAEIQATIDNFIRKHDSGPCSGYCYISVQKYLNHIAGRELPAPPSGSNVTPLKPIGKGVKKIPIYEP